jgi:hypothetical protein
MMSDAMTMTAARANAVSRSAPRAVVDYPQNIRMSLDEAVRMVRGFSRKMAIHSDESGEPIIVGYGCVQGRMAQIVGDGISENTARYSFFFEEETPVVEFA